MPSLFFSKNWQKTDEKTYDVFGHLSWRGETLAVSAMNNTV
jgi:hypothetical protein